MPRPGITTNVAGHHRLKTPRCRGHGDGASQPMLGMALQTGCSRQHLVTSDLLAFDGNDLRACPR